LETSQAEARREFGRPYFGDLAGWSPPGIRSALLWKPRRLKPAGNSIGLTSEISRAEALANGRRAYFAGLAGW